MKTSTNAAAASASTIAAAIRNPAAVRRAIMAPVASYLAARVVAEELTEQLDALSAKVVAAGDYKNEETGDRILDPKRAWLMSDRDAAVYYELRDDAIAAAGYDVKRGHCPALVAECAQRDAADVLARVGPAWLLPGIVYPGTAGMAIRSAEVSGAAGIFIDAAFTHAKRREALRASMRADRFLPVLFRDFWPRYSESVPAVQRRLLEKLASRRYGADFDSDTGVVRFARPHRLRGDLHGIPRARLRSPLGGQRAAVF